MTDNTHRDRLHNALENLRPETFLGPAEQNRQSLASRMVDLATPGVSIAVIDRFDLAWAESAGVRKAHSPELVTPRTPFQAGSISKPVFALAVMRLYQDGLLDLDTDVGKYLTSWHLPKGDDGWSPRITLRHLLSHTAGTTVHGFPGYSVAGPKPTLVQILNGTRPANTPPVYVDVIPGLHFRYSGGGTTIAQLAVMDATGRSFPELLRELVLDPLEMNDSSFEQPPSPEFSKEAATGHGWNGVPIPGGWHIYPEMAAAGLWTTAADLARLGVAVMRGLRGDRTALGLKSELLAAMLQPQLPGQAEGTDFVGLGWACAGKGEDFRFGHTGGDEGFLAQVRLFPARGQGAIVMNNSLQGWSLRAEILDSIGREYGWPKIGEPSEVVDVPITANHAGRYRASSGVELLIEQTATCLLLQSKNQAAISLRPCADGHFVARIPKLQARFETTSAGHTRLSLSQAGMTIEAEKIRS